MSRLQDKREEANLSAQEVATRSHISPSKLSKLEHGKLKLKLADAIRLARVLGCSADDLDIDESADCAPTPAEALP